MHRGQTANPRVVVSGPVITTFSLPFYGVSSITLATPGERRPARTGGFQTKSIHAAFACGLVIAALLLSVLVSGPASPIRSASAAAPLPTLSIGFLQTVDSLNPYKGINDPSYLLYGLLYDYPYAFDQDGNLIPNLITSSSCANPQCTAWNFTVRQNVYWSDGSTMSPRDVNFTFNYDSQNLGKLWTFEPYFNQVVQCPKKWVLGCGAVISGPTNQNVTVYFKVPFAEGKNLFAPIIQYAQ
jgi:ABC-type transport system substrate-binding protein